MVICMNIGTDGERHISRIRYYANETPTKVKQIAELLTLYYDEVYITDFKENEAFIDEVVLRGCRV